jgi:hypothetical protein
MDYLHGSHFHPLYHAPRYQSFLDADAHSSLKGLHTLDQVFSKK